MGSLAEGLESVFPDHSIGAANQFFRAATEVRETLLGGEVEMRFVVEHVEIFGEVRAENLARFGVAVARILGGCQSDLRVIGRRAAAAPHLAGAGECARGWKELVVS